MCGGRGPPSTHSQAFRVSKWLQTKQLCSRGVSEDRCSAKQLRGARASLLMSQMESILSTARFKWLEGGKNETWSFHRTMCTRFPPTSPERNVWITPPQRAEDENRCYCRAKHESSFSSDAAQIKRRLCAETLCVYPIHSGLHVEYDVLQST